MVSDQTLASLKAGVKVVSKVMVSGIAVTGAARASKARKRPGPRENVPVAPELMKKAAARMDTEPVMSVESLAMLN
jgi:hypothetical protein